MSAIHASGHELPGPVIFTAEQIATRVAELGAEITADYHDRIPIFVTVLRGAIVFASDLVRTITIPHEMDFLAMSAYGEDEPGGQARILKDVTMPMQGRDLILVEDIIDTGLTLRFILRWLETHEPESIAVCTLLDRPHRRLVDVDIAYRGFTVPDRFYVGYGFDYQQRYRNLPCLVELQLPR